MFNDIPKPVIIITLIAIVVFSTQIFAALTNHDLQSQDIPADLNCQHQAYQNIYICEGE
jgi:hypothetical protein